MTQFESNTLRQELAKSQQAVMHPDADMLTAFAENALLLKEREAILVHLAACKDCRATLNLVTESMPEDVTAPKPFLITKAKRSPMRVWIPWGMAAAATIVGATVLTLRYERNHAEQNPIVAINKPSAQDISPPLPPAPQAPVRARTNQSTDQAEQSSVVSSANAAVQQAQKQAVDFAQSIPLQQRVEAKSDTTATTEEEAAKKSALGKMQSQQRVAVAESTLAKQASSPPAASAKESYSYFSADKAASPAFANAVTARALAEPVAKAAARPHWRINDAGQPERSNGNGGWETVAIHGSGRMHVLSVFGNEVWVGGENSQVYRSFNNGATWQGVSLPTKNGHSHVIAHIQTAAQRTITVIAADGTTWTTADNGNSWN